MDQSLWKNLTFSTFFIALFIKPRKAVFLSRKSWRIFPEISKIWGFTLIFVSRVKKVLFSIKNGIKHFSGLFCIKTQDKNLSNFWSKPWTIPFGKMQILWHSFIFVFRFYNKSFFLSRISSNTFSFSFFA